jgi:GTP diphosphokinase / guanosine-3',5'-bis(diphosphate) 3'-diphosphatase
VQPRLNDLLDTIGAYAPDADLDLVMRAYFYAAKAHKDQSRKSGEAYVTHPLAVALILVDERMDVDTVACALLHDTIEDTLATHEELSELFSTEIADLVDGVTKIGKLEFRSKEHQAAESFRKMMLAMSKDIRVILVKLADRLHNMRTLGSMPDHKKRRISRETIDIYAPMAGRLGISRWQSELEDLCFEHLEPEAFVALKQKMEDSREEREAYIQRVRDHLDSFLTGHGVSCTVKGRAKHLTSIHRKMVADQREFEQLHDLLAFRVIVPGLGDCYAALGHVHGCFPPFPDRIKDYIAMPKNNGYRSLHTTVMGPENRPIEIQIRTEEMDRVADHGIAAHWKYKAGHLALKKDDIIRIAELREVLETAREVEDPDEFMEAVKIDLYHHDVFVFTPAGDVKQFPLGATALDFAYSVHTEVGNSCVGARVNGKMVALKYTLQSGDHVEVLTNKSQHPKRDWLDIVKTSRALGRIRRYLREQERETGVRMGKEMLDNELKRHGSSLNGVVKNGQLKRVCKARKVSSLEDLLVELVQGHKAMAPLLRELLPDKEWDTPVDEEGAIAKILNRIRRRNQSPVLISGEEDVLVGFAKCCNPLPGEPISGFITRGRGISVHRRNCAQLLAQEPERRVHVRWDRGENEVHTGTIRVICVDRPGLLANITKACTDAGINISSAQVQQLEDAKAHCDLDVSVQDVDELQGLMRRIQRIKGVISVDRIARA